MPVVRSVKNQYRGINAHLHSDWQATGEWNSFHAIHIADLTRFLRQKLLPMGYTADIEQSLQIRKYGKSAGKPESDVLIFDLDPIRAGQSSTPDMGLAAQVMTVPEILSLPEEDEVIYYKAIAIYREGRWDEREPVAWVELLSPSNKPGGRDGINYHEKSLKIMQSGIVFVEIDYLHELPPTFKGLPIVPGNANRFLRLVLIRIASWSLILAPRLRKAKRMYINLTLINLFQPLLSL